MFKNKERLNQSKSEEDIYEGELKDGEPNGQVTITFSDGTKYVGEFKDGTDWNTTGYDKD